MFAGFQAANAYCILAEGYQKIDINDENKEILNNTRIMINILQLIESQSNKEVSKKRTGAIITGAMNELEREVLPKLKSELGI